MSGEPSLDPPSLPEECAQCGAIGERVSEKRSRSGLQLEEGGPEEATIDTLYRCQNCGSEWSVFDLVPAHAVGPRSPWGPWRRGMGGALMRRLFP